MQKLLNTLVLTLFTVSAAAAATGDLPPTNSGENGLEAPRAKLWVNGIGQGFQSSAQSFSLQAGAAQGLNILGTLQVHDLALVSLAYGHMLSRTLGQDHFYRGNWELRAELFGGSQFSPERDWVIGLAPHLRYNFATGTRFVPYLDGGAGVTATSVGPPDLSNIFEFNLQATLGTYFFLRSNLALSIETRYLHLSCAGISDPNRGLNAVGGMVGLSIFF